MYKLTTFTWSEYNFENPEPTAALLTFVRNNPQLDLLAADHATSIAFNKTLLDTITAPCPQTLKLTQLHLGWHSKIIPPDHLRILSKITTIQKLWLTAGNQTGWRYNWFVDHEGVIQSLEPLRNLELLGFTRDTYVVATDWVEGEVEVDNNGDAMMQDETVEAQGGSVDTNSAEAQSLDADGEIEENEQHSSSLYFFPRPPPLMGEPTDNVDEDGNDDSSLGYYNSEDFPRGVSYHDWIFPEDEVPPRPEGFNYDDDHKFMEYIRIIRESLEQLARAQNARYRTAISAAVSSASMDIGWRETDYIPKV